MASGKQIYSKIEQQVNHLDRVKSNIESELRKNQNAQQANQAKRIECMNTISTVHVDALLDGSKAPVRAVNNEVDGLIKRRNEAYRDVLIEMDRSRTNLRLADGGVDQAQADFEAMRSRVYEDLAKSGDFIEKRRLMDEALKHAENCKAVALDIKDETTEKLVAYRNDPIFQYLMARRFGANDYVGKGLFRPLDAWLSKKIDYTQAKHDFDVMSQLPDLAQSKVEEARLAANRASDEYRVIEQQVRRNHRYDDFEKAVVTAKEKREECRNQIATHQKAIDAFQTKNDGIMDTIKKKVLDTMAQFSFATLDRLTKETGSRSDDLALHQYQELNEEAPRLAEQEREIQARLQKAAQDFKKVKTLRDSFSSNNYDSSRREFSSSFDIDRMMQGYLIGQFSINDFDRSCSSSSSITRESSVSYRNESSGWNNGGGNGGSGGSDFTTSGSISDSGGTTSTSDSF
jgi:hypothetical protein